MASPSRALTKRNADSALMPPPPPPKRQKRPAEVLDEDVYSDALSHIIARDFFPGLLETEAQKEYMEALDSKNSDRIREAGRKLTQVMTPLPGGRRMGRGTSFAPRGTNVADETPREFIGDTPSRTPVHSEITAGTKQSVDVNLSLGSFQAKYTSEDNESFNVLLDKQNEERTANYAFFHNGNKIPSARQIAHRARELNLLENGKKNSTALTVTNSAGEARRILSSGRPSEDLDDRPASVDSFPIRQGPRNSFMFGPDGVEDQALTRAQQAHQASNAPPRAVQHSATRFPVAATHPENAIPASPSMSAIDAAISGKPRATESEIGYNGAETPRVNGYTFVDAEPTPSELGVPVTDEEADAAERETVSQFLPKVDENGPNLFQLFERSKREDLHYKLVERADAGRRKGGRVDQLRNLGITPGRTPTPRFSSGANIKGRASMTPAAQNLAQKIATPRHGSSMFSSGRTEKASWTPNAKGKN